MILCGTRLRPPDRAGNSAIVRLAGDAGAAGLVIDGGCTLAGLPALLVDATRAGLVCPALVGPLPDAPLERGKRLPHLAAWDDKEERQAAVKVATTTMEVARGLGVTEIILELGRVDLAVPAETVRRHFARAELDEDEPGARTFRRALEERRSKGARVLDACRAGLEPVLMAAERIGVTVLLAVSRGVWGVPSPRELHLLTHELSGAPLGLVAAPGRRALLRTLGLEGPPERWRDFDQATRFVYATDAVGLDADLLPGLGEADLEALTPVAPRASHAVSGRTDSTPEEVAAAVALVDRLARRPVPGG